METLPNEIWLKIFSYLDLQDLNRCAAVCKKFQKFAYEKSLWQKLPVNLAVKQVSVEFIQQVGMFSEEKGKKSRILREG